MEKFVETQYEAFNAQRKIADAKQADDFDLAELMALENQIKIVKK